MHKMTAMLLLCSATACVPTAAAQTFPDRGRTAVVDAANVIPDDQERALNQRLVEWEHDSHHQLVVATVPSLQGYDIKDYGYKLFRQWGLGRKGVNDGIVLLLAPNERKVRIEVGYALEPVLTDATTSDIIGTYIVPHLKQNEIPEALSSGADTIMGAVNASETAQQVASDATKAQRAKDDGSSPWWWLLLGLPVGLIAVPFAGYRWRQSRRKPEVKIVQSPTTALLDGYEFAEGRVRLHAADIRRAAVDRVVGSPPTPSRAPARPTPTPPRRSSSVGERRTSSDDSGYYAAGAAAASSYSSSSSYDSSSSSSSSYDSGSSSSSSSYDSGSSSSGYDSGGGSCGGGGSDSSY